MVWSGSATESRIFSGAKKEDGSYDVSYLRGCFLKGPEGDPQNKGSWSYPYRGSPKDKPDCGGLLAAVQRAKGTGNDPGVAAKAQRLRASAGCLNADSEEVCLNSGDIFETDDEIIVNCGVMSSGVFNNKLKIVEELQESTRWWNGLPIVINNYQEIADHPETGITTNKTIRVGQLLNPEWDETYLKINAEAHFIKDYTPEWLQDELRNRKVMGVSGAYFCDFLQENGEHNGKKYDAIEIGYVPNNLAIVKKPACKPEEGCGLNVNTDIPLDTSASTDYWINSTSIYPENVIIYQPKPQINKSEDIKMSEDIKEDKTEELKLQMNEKDKTIEELTKEKVELNAKIGELEGQLKAIEETKRKEDFLKQFPEQNREKAAELYGKDLMMNMALIKDLMTVEGEDTKITGKEFVQENEEIEGPSPEDVKKAILG